MITSQPPRATVEQCDCVTLCGDDPRISGTKVQPCPFRRRLLAEQRQTEVLRWVNITPETMPDANELVLIEREDDGVNEPTWPGYWDGEQWCDVDGDLFPGKPIGWCSWPGGRKGVRP